MFRECIDHLVFKFYSSCNYIQCNVTSTSAKHANLQAFDNDMCIGE